MILATWPSEPARALAAVLTGSAGIREIVEIEPYDAKRALLEGSVDVALLPTFDAVRAEDLVDLLPGVGLVGERGPSQALVLSAPLDQIKSVAFDPRYAQEVLLSQIVLKENYGGKPSFVPIDQSESVADRLSKYDAVLITASDVPSANVTLDLGQEWLELTLRPMVWGLFAGRAGEIHEETAAVIRETAREATHVEELRVDGELVYQFTLDGYALDGLEELIKHFYFHGALEDFPTLPFINVPDDENEPVE